MKNSVLFLALIGLFFATQSNAQTKYTRIGIMGYEKFNAEMAVPEGVDADSRWIVPPIFFEKERRFLKFFTLGTEINFSRYGLDADSYGANHKFRVTNLGMEVQGKVSIPIVEIFEVYGQFGIGYMHSFIKNSSSVQGQTFDQKFGIGYITSTASIGGSIIFAESIGLFIEAGVMKGRSLKTINEIYDDSIAGASYDTPKFDLGSMGQQHAEGQTPFVKLGVVFQISE